MPTYDYECDACGHRFELFQSIKAAPIRKCPTCGKLKARRLIGIGAGVIFKGSGFYCTDYRNKSYAAAAKKDGAETSAGGGDNGSGKTPAADKPAAAQGNPQPTSPPRTNLPLTPPRQKRTRRRLRGGHDCRLQIADCRLKDEETAKKWVLLFLCRSICNLQSAI